MIENIDIQGSFECPARLWALNDLIRILFDKSKYELVISRDVSVIKIYCRLSRVSKKEVLYSLCELLGLSLFLSERKITIVLKEKVKKDSESWWNSFINFRKEMIDLSLLKLDKIVPEEEVDFWKCIPEYIIRQSLEMSLDGYFKRKYIFSIPVNNGNGFYIPIKDLSANGLQVIKRSLNDLYVSDGGFDIDRVTAISLSTSGIVYVSAILKDGRVSDTGLILTTKLIASLMPFLTLSQQGVEKMNMSKNKNTNATNLFNFRTYYNWHNFQEKPNTPSEINIPEEPIHILINKSIEGTKNFMMEYFSEPYGRQITPEMNSASQKKYSLEDIKKKFNLAVKDTSGILLVQSNQWYRDRKIEISQERIVSLLKHKEFREKKQDDFSFMERVSAILSLFDDWEIANGLSFFDVSEITGEKPSGKFIFMPECETILRYKNICGFYKGLNPALRRGIISSGIPIAALNQEQVVSLKTFSIVIQKLTDRELSARKIVLKISPWKSPLTLPFEYPLGKELDIQIDKN